MKIVLINSFIFCFIILNVQAGEGYSWGENNHGQLGDGTTTDHFSPAQFGTVNNWITNSTGIYINQAIKTDGTLWAWGTNSDGRLGDGTTINRTSPVQIGTANNWSKVSCKATHTLALKSDGTLWAWGTNGSGQLGDGTTTFRTTPVQIGSDNDWAFISNGMNFSVAIKTDGTLWAWGENNYSQLGDGTTTDRHIPVQIGTATNWAFVNCGYWHSLAIKTDGTLWAWGSNGTGALGDGTTTERNSPVQIGIATNWETVSCGCYHTVALKNDGTLWTWGYNNYCQLGDGTTTNRTSPAQIGTATNWETVSCSNHHNLALKSDGTIWGWGYNDYGQLGDGTTITRNSPVQLGTAANWGAISAGYDHSVAFSGSILPTLIAPLNGATTVNTTPNFVWNTYTGATGYTLQVSKNQSFSSIVFDVSTTSTSYSPSIALDCNTGYFWRVKATTTTFTSDWSFVRNFSTSAKTSEKQVAIRLALQGLWNNSTGVHKLAVLAVELRNGSNINTSTMTSRKIGYVQADGRVFLDFGDVRDGNYWIVVRCNGYLPVASSAQISLSSSGVNWDFTTASTQSLGGASAMILPDGTDKWQIRAGDFNSSRSVTASDANIYLQNSGANVTSFIPTP